MKRLLLILLILPTNKVLATTGDIFNNTTVPQNSVKELINLLINAVLGILATVAVLFVIIGGFQYITSAGNPDSIQKAKNTILYAILGVVTSIIAFAVVKFITDNLV